MIHFNSTSRVSDIFIFSRKNSIYTASIIPFFYWIIEKDIFDTNK